MYNILTTFEYSTELPINVGISGVAPDSILPIRISAVVFCINSMFGIQVGKRMATK